MLECPGGIAQSEGHHRVFVQPITASECGFPLLPGGYPQPIVTIANIELGEILGFADPFQQLADKGKGVAILDRDLVEPTVIHAEPQCSVLLLRKDNGSPTRRLRVANEPLSEVLLNILPHSLQL